MDKRWIIIIIVLAIGIGCLYLVADNSTSVGNAVVSIGDVILTIPPSFTNFQTHGETVSVENKYTGEKMYFELIDDGNDSLSKYNNKIEELKHLENVSITKNKTIEIDGVKVHTIYYQKVTPNNTTEYIVGYFDKYNATFGATFWNFENTEKGESNLEFVVTTLYPDYKKPKD